MPEEIAASESENEAAETSKEEARETETVDLSAEVDKWKEFARKNEKRAKENADKARRLDEIEAASKSEAERSADRIAELESELECERARSLRSRIQAKFGIGDDDADLFLVGSDEETLTRQAERLADRESESKKKGNHVPSEGRVPGNSNSSTADQFAEFAGNFFTR